MPTTNFVSTAALVCFRVPNERKGFGFFPLLRVNGKNEMGVYDFW